MSADKKVFEIISEMADLAGAANKAELKDKALDLIRVLDDSAAGDSNMKIDSGYALHCGFLQYALTCNFRNEQ